MKSLVFTYKSIILFFSFIWTPLIFATPEIHFSEFKILLTEKKSSFNHKLFNQGDSRASCTISFIDYDISEDGNLAIPKKGTTPKNSAAKILRTSPRRVIIPARGAQKVKIIARNIRSLSDGEKNSYLSLRCKDADFVAQAGVSLSPNFVFNIPVTVRKGDLKVSGEITDVKHIAENNSLDFNFTRKGSRSLYGNIQISDSDGEIGSVNGITHYLEATTIPYKIMLTRAPKGKITLNYAEEPRFGGDVKIEVEIN